MIKKKKKEVSIEKSSVWKICWFFMKNFNCSIQHHSLQKFEYCNNVIAKLNYLLLEDSDICYHF